MTPARTVVATLIAVVVVGVAGAAAVVLGGVYDVSAITQQPQAVFSLLEFGLHRSVRVRARGIEPPPLADAATVARGAVCFRDKCVQCHGAPGVARNDIGRSMQPLPSPLVDASARWRPAELYWLTRHGIGMSGMPAWQHRLSDADIWAVVAFVQQLPSLDAPAYRATMVAVQDAQCLAPQTPPMAPSAERGRAALNQYACNACHTIPGITGSDVLVGPPLAGMGVRELIAGKLSNTPDNMVRWLRDPKSVEPDSAMPDLQVNERDARDMAAYLATLR